MKRKIKPQMLVARVCPNRPGLSHQFTSSMTVNGVNAIRCSWCWTKEK